MLVDKTIVDSQQSHIVPHCATKKEAHTRYACLRFLRCCRNTSCSLALKMKSEQQCVHFLSWSPHLAICFNHRFSAESLFRKLGHNDLN